MLFHLIHFDVVWDFFIHSINNPVLNLELTIQLFILRSLRVRVDLQYLNLIQLLHVFVQIFDQLLVRRLKPLLQSLSFLALLILIDSFLGLRKCILKADIDFDLFSDPLQS